MNLLYLTILFPLISFFILIFFGNIISEKINSFIGVISIGLSSIISVYITIDFFKNYNNNTKFFIQNIYDWILIDNFKIPVSLNIDGLSLLMLNMITIVGFFIHIYASWYMKKKEGYSRFFAYTNIFIANMIILVLADNMLLMYLGWEIVGICSYLLIGFYYEELKNSEAAIKSFIITRIGDVFLIIGLFIVYKEFGTLNIHDLIYLLSKNKIYDSSIINYISLMFLIGGIGKSAQFPMQIWLLDAMKGPTPVSALIHSATMVTSGIYLIIRTHELFDLAPEILYLTRIIGITTLLLASFSALVQTNIKKILAFSTISQIGYMFLALGLQSWSSAIFHLITHSFFKTLLFLSSGSIILSCNNEQNIFKMGGLKKSLPFIYVCFLIGGSSLSAFPLLTSGFYSKDQILFNIFVNNYIVLGILGLLGTFITSLYTFRMIFIIFYGNKKININYIDKSIYHYLPLIIMMILSTFIGTIIIAPLKIIFPNYENIHNNKIILEIVSSIIVFSGIFLSYILYIKKYNIIKILTNNFFMKRCNLFLFYDCGFNFIYKKFFIEPYLKITIFLSIDPINIIINIFSYIILKFKYLLTQAQNGNIHWYIKSVSFSIIIIVMILIFI